MHVVNSQERILEIANSRLSEFHTGDEPLISTINEIEYSPIQTRMIAESEEFRHMCFYLKTFHPEISRVSITYDGSGDSGWIEDADFCIDLSDHGHKEFHILTTKQSVKLIGKQAHEKISKLAQDYTYAMLGTNHGGWEINEGSYGEVTYTFGEEVIEMEHNERITEVEHFDHTFEFELEPSKGIQSLVEKREEIVKSLIDSIKKSKDLKDDTNGSRTNER